MKPAGDAFDLNCMQAADTVLLNMLTMFLIFVPFEQFYSDMETQAPTARRKASLAFLSPICALMILSVTTIVNYINDYWVANGKF